MLHDIACHYFREVVTPNKLNLTGTTTSSSGTCRYRKRSSPDSEEKTERGHDTPVLGRFQKSPTRVRVSRWRGHKKWYWEQYEERRS